MTTHQGYRLIISNPEKPKVDRTISDYDKEKHRRRTAIEEHRERLALKDELKECWE